MGSATPKIHSRWKFLIALLALVAIAAFTFNRSEKIKDRLDHSVVANNTKASILLDMRVGAMQRIKEFSRLAKLTQSKDVQALSEQIQKSAGEYFETEAKLNKLLNSSPQTSKEELGLMQKIIETGVAAAPVVAKIQQLAIANQTAQVPKLVKEELAHGPVKTWLDSVNEMIIYENELTAQAANLASIEFEQLRILVLLSSALVVIMGMAAAWLTLSRFGPGNTAKA